MTSLDHRGGGGVVDAIVIGSGPNGLVAANLLADAGWQVVVLETQPDIGGAVRSDSAVAQGSVHDTFSSFYPLAAASPTIQALQLEKHGLEWRHAPSVVGTPLADGSWAVLHRDREETAVGLDELAVGAARRCSRVLADQAARRVPRRAALGTGHPGSYHCDDDRDRQHRSDRRVGQVPADRVGAAVEALVGQFFAEPDDQIHGLGGGRVRVRVGSAGGGSKTASPSRR